MLCFGEVVGHAFDAVFEQTHVEIDQIAERPRNAEAHPHAYRIRRDDFGDDGSVWLRRGKSSDDVVTHDVGGRGRSRADAELVEDAGDVRVDRAAADRERFGDLGTEPIEEKRATPEALRAHLKAEIDKWAPIIKKAGVYAD